MRLRGVEGFLHHQRATGALYRELHPAPDLAAFVACGWISVVGHQAGTPAMPVVPDGCSDIITCDDLPPILVGPDTQARWPALPAGTVITGLRFRPGALRGVVGIPAVDLVDNNVELGDLSESGRRLQADLLGADTLHGRLALMEHWVRGRARLQPRDMGVIQACQAMVAKPTMDLADLATGMGWSTRRLHREFTASCGYGPKTMQRILRVQRVTRVAHRTRRRLSLSAIAAASGFADQAHMTREFRAITGFTPATFLPRSQPGLGRWLDADWTD